MREDSHCGNYGIGSFFHDIAATAIAIKRRPSVQWKVWLGAGGVTVRAYYAANIMEPVSAL